MAAENLVRVEEQGAFVSRLAVSELSARDRRFVTDVVAGVTRLRRWIDFVIARSAERNVARLEPMLRQILRIGAYEILERGTPAYASVNEAVALAKSAVRPGAGSLVNAVLRKVDSAREDLPEPKGNTVQRLAIRRSHPDWIVRRWYAQFGESDTAALLEWNNRRPSFALRVNTLAHDADELLERLGAAGVEAEVSPYLPDFVRVDGLQDVLDSIMGEGLAAVQDEAAGLAVRVLDPRPGETVIDSCAAPGGKIAYCCTLMRNEGKLIGVDANEARLESARRGLEVLGCTSAAYYVADATDLEQVASGLNPDRILVDAPCSGFGVMAKRADLRWRRRPSDIPELTHLQDRLLDAAARAVRIGGVIVYSTCTIEPSENEDRVSDFLERHEGFESESVAPYVPPEFVTTEGHYLSLPQRQGIDGAFAARLRRIR